VARDDVVRAFPEVEEIATADSGFLKPLSPLTFAAIVLQDPSRRRLRFEQTDTVLSNAAARDECWIDDGHVFTETLVRAWYQLCAQTERITDALAPERDPYMMDAVLDVVSKLSEGPFRRLGGLVLIADEVASGTASKLTEDSLFRVRKLSTVHRELSRLAPALVSDIDRTIRNAEAHYDYEITPTTVQIRHLPPNARSVLDAQVDEFYHDDVIEQTLNLFEAVQSMNLALLRMMWGHARVSVREGFRAHWLSRGVLRS
jgi:hypothetical protein